MSWATSLGQAAAGLLQKPRHHPPLPSTVPVAAHPTRRFRGPFLSGVETLAASLMADGGTLALLGYTKAHQSTGLLQYAAARLVPDAP